MAPATEPVDIGGLRTYRGSCHCGAVAFECALDLSDSTRCNCSVCRKQRFWKSIARADGFRLLRGADALSDYQFDGHRIHHRFCRFCGVKPFGHADIPELGPFYAINIACIDGLSDAQLAAIPVRYEDGRAGNYQEAPAIAGYL